MKKVILSIIAILINVAFVQAIGPNVWRKNILQKIKYEISQESPRYIPAYKALRDFCDAEIERAPYSVMDKKLVPPSGNKHDYISIGRYWWPDPTKPDGLPYIRRDGQSNPERKQLDRERMGDMMDAVAKLALMYYYNDEEKYAQKAVHLLRVWFLNEDTKMSPNMQFGQYVPGHNNNKGRAEGVLDTYGMVKMLSGVTYLQSSPSLTTTDLKGLKKWFNNYLDWILTSEQGIAERYATNNHAIAYDVQVVAFAQFTGRNELAQEVINNFLSKRIFKQVKKDGSQPKELARQTGFGYSNYNIEHMLDMCMLSGETGKQMYNENNGEKCSINGSIEYMSQYLGKPKSKFPYQQIKEWNSVQNNLAWILQRSTLLKSNTIYKEMFYKFNTSKLTDYQRLIYTY